MTLADLLASYLQQNSPSGGGMLGDTAHNYPHRLADLLKGNGLLGSAPTPANEPTITGGLLAQASIPAWRATVMPNGTMRTFASEYEARQWLDLMGAKPGSGGSIQHIRITPKVPGK